MLVDPAAPQVAVRYLVVFDRHTEISLYLGRTRHTALVGQRIGCMPARRDSARARGRPA